MKEVSFETYDMLIERSINDARNTETASQAIQLILTLSGHLEFAEMFKSLTYFEQEIYKLVTEDALKFTGSEEEDDSDLLYFYYIKKQKLFITELKQEYGILIGSMKIGSYRTKIDDLFEENNIRHLKEVKECDLFFSGHSGQEIIKMVNEIKHFCQHMAPISLFVNHKLYSNFYELNNLYPAHHKFDADYILCALTTKSIEDWEEEDKIFVYSLYLLFKSGIQTRAEEINNQQITLSSLHIFFEDKYTTYCEILQLPLEPIFKASSLMEKSLRVRELFAKVRETVLIYRDINGISLQKTEKFLGLNHASLCTKRDNALEEMLRNQFGLISADHSSLYELSRKLVYQELTGQIAGNDRHNSIHALVHSILSTLGEKTNSDVCFSRFFQNIGAFIKLLREKKIEDICALKLQNYSCYIVPSARLAHRMPVEMLAKMCVSIASRMLYNSWHYIPGNFQSYTDIIENRDYYFPPQLPDITKLSKYHHIGHVKLSVNNCIRAPHSITIDDTILHAFMDIRLVRLGDEVYQESDLLDSLVYTQYLYQVYQAIVDEVAEQNTSYSLIEYDKDWYVQYYSLEAAPNEKSTVY